MNGVLIPQRIFVGDTAQFLFPLSEKEYKTLTARGFSSGIPLPLKNIVQNDAMTIQEIQIVKRDSGHYLALTFIPWETGEIDFPVLSFLKLKHKLPSIHVASLLEVGERVSLQPPKPPLLIPGSDYLLYGAAVIGVSCLVVIATGIWLLFRKLRRKHPIHTAKKRLGMLRKRLKRLYKEAKKIQKYLPPLDSIDTDFITTDQRSAEKSQKKIEDHTDIYKKTNESIRSWYAGIDYCLREYIQALCTDKAIAAPEKEEAYFFSATYTELTATLTEVFASKRKIVDLFCIFYAMLERQRFGSTFSELIRNYIAVSQDMLKKIPRIAERTETEYTLLRQAESIPTAQKKHTESRGGL